MKTIKGPALFLAQFAGDAAPFNSWQSITRWAADCGYVGVQIPSWDARLFDLDRAATSKDYCDEIKGIAAESGARIVTTRVSPGNSSNRRPRHRPRGLGSSSSQRGKWKCPRCNGRTR